MQADPLVNEKKLNSRSIIVIRNKKKMNSGTQAVVGFFLIHTYYLF